MTKNPDITERFLQAYEWLQKHDRVIDKKSFAKKIGVSPSFLTEIAKREKQRRNFSDTEYSKRNTVCPQIGF